ncbi:neurofilament heavy polypeptide-like [Athalia rosae]|uniref:neurofilament heavy polypeptide-like n=1 Tax=Athalia rosae TaxID=37344 RepID=UPI0020332755|nr:neurofilament heavy polypeptide-like [Athalia rosae]
MKILFVLAAVLAVSLAAPTEVAVSPGKIATPEKSVPSEPEKDREQYFHKVASPVPEPIVEDKVEPVSASDKVAENNDAEKVKEKVSADKLGEKSEEKIEDKVKVDQAVAASEEPLPTRPEEEKPVVVVVATPVANEETEKEKAKEQGGIQVQETKTKEEEIKEEKEAAEKEEDNNDVSAICRASTGVTLEQVLAVAGAPPVDPPRSMKCYLKCMEEHLGTLEAEISIKDSATDSEKPSEAPKEEAETVDDPCLRPQTDDPCDSAYLRFYCNFKSSDKISVL